MTEPSLTRLDPPGTPRAVILMLHGGKARSSAVVDGRSASWRRAAAMQHSIAGRAHAAGAGAWLLRNRIRGWNDGRDPVEDARWALAEVRRELGEVPVVLLGHSMGARTSVHVADAEPVVGVVGLAPWFPRGEAIDALAGKRLVAAHGRRDRITSYNATDEYVARARAVAATAELRDMGQVGHYMLKRVAAWNDVAVESALSLLG